MATQPGGPASGYIACRRDTLPLGIHCLSLYPGDCLSLYPGEASSATAPGLGGLDPTRTPHGSPGGELRERTKGQAVYRHPPRGAAPGIHCLSLCIQEGGEAIGRLVSD